MERLLLTNPKPKFHTHAHTLDSFITIVIQLPLTHSVAACHLKANNQQINGIQKEHWLCALNNLHRNVNLTQNSIPALIPLNLASRLTRSFPAQAFQGATTSTPTTSTATVSRTPTSPRRALCPRRSAISGGWCGSRGPTPSSWWPDWRRNHGSVLR